MLRKSALAVSCLLLPISAYAGITDIRAANNQIGIQAVSTNVDYTETGNGIFGTVTGTLDTEKGDVPGAAIFLSTMSGSGQYFAAEYDHSSGQTTYTGMPITGGVFGSIVGVSSAALTNFNVRFGQGFEIGSVGARSITPFMLTPYVELGHHEWDRGVNYGEIYTHNYFAVGTLWQLSPASSRLVLSADAMLGTTFRANIVVNSGPGLNGFSGALGNSTLYKVGLAADYAFSNHFHGNAGIDYMSFGYGMSAVYPVGGGFVSWEPDSRTNYTIVKLGVGYAF